LITLIINAHCTRELDCRSVPSAEGRAAERVWSDHVGT
jgi:hypothetical protein